MAVAASLMRELWVTRHSVRARPKRFCLRSTRSSNGQPAGGSSSHSSRISGSISKRKSHAPNHSRVPLSVFFAVPGTELAKYSDEQRRRLVRWFWRACFTRRYSSGVLRYLKTDIDEISKLRAAATSTLDHIAAVVEPSFFVDNSFRIDSVNTKTLFYCSLLTAHAVSFLVPRSRLQTY